MRETQFIEQKKAEWQSLETMLQKKERKPDEMHRLFVQLTDDLSYARTFYPYRSVRQYLNGLTKSLFFHIYKHRKSNFSKISRFWTTDLPLLMYESRRQFLFATLLFLFATLVGAFSTAMDPEFPRVILGDGYVDETLRNIERGDPMAIYKESEAFGMSVGITVNNILVAFRTFILGIFAAIGTGIILLYNGIMVGAFQYFFYQQGHFRESFLTIWTHGTLEISAIILAGAAGLVMGKGLLFPGSFNRMQSFQMSARKGIKIMVGITPIFILAGFIEGYLTRFTETPDSIRLLFILVCLFFVLFYFVFYPQAVYSRLKRDAKLPTERLIPDDTSGYAFDSIIPSGNLISFVLQLFKNKMVRLLGISLAISAGYLGCMLLFAPPLDDLFTPRSAQLSSFESWFNLPNLRIYYINSKSWIPFIYMVFATSFLMTAGNTIVSDIAQHRATRLGWQSIVLNILPALLLQGLLFCSTGAGLLLAFLFFLAPFLWSYTQHINTENAWECFRNSLRLFFNGRRTHVPVSLINGALAVLVIFLLNSALFWFFLSVISWIIPASEGNNDMLSLQVNVLVQVFTLCIIWLFWQMSAALLYYSLVEIFLAEGLQTKVEEVFMGRNKRRVL